MSSLITALFMLYCTLLQAADWKVVKIKGDVQSTIQKGAAVSLKKGDLIKPGSTISSKKGYLRIRAAKTTLAYQGKFKSKLTNVAGDKASTTDLIYGKMRVLTDKKENSKLRVKTPTAVAGVRGTDFFISYLPLLGESEVICFESKIDFQSGNSKVLVSAGQWGGHGGRFGSKISPPIDLPKNVLQHFSNSLPIKD